MNNTKNLLGGSILKLKQNTISIMRKHKAAVNVCIRCIEATQKKAVFCALMPVHHN